MLDVLSLVKISVGTKETKIVNKVRKIDIIWEPQGLSDLNFLQTVF